MKKLLLLILCLPLIAKGQQVTTLSLLEELAKQHQLELCYNPDLVNLEKVVDCNCDSLALNDCLKQLSIKSQLEVTIEGNNLVVAHPGKQTIQMSGKVVELTTGEELPFAHILQRDWGTGSITNTVGEFQLNVPRALSGLNLEFSCLGYADTSVVIPETDTTQLLIYLRPKPFNINEVLVLPNGNTAEELVRQATKRIKRNYHRRKCQMEAFYRRTGMRDTTFVQLVEAALLIEDKGVDMPSNTTKIKTQEVRKSRNYLIPESELRAWASKRMENMIWGGHRNVFYKCYGRNPVRNYKDDWWYKPLTQYEDFKYEFEGAMWMDTIKVYKIKYVDDDLYPDGTRTTHLKNVDCGGYIYINADDFAIVKMNHWDRFLNDHPARKYALPDGYGRRSEQSYQKINGKYYLKYIRGSTYPTTGDFIIFENPDAKEEDRIVKHRQWAEELLVITNVITERQQRERIRFKDQLDRHENSYETNYPYNPDFWSTYGMLKQEPLPGKAIEDLEWEEALGVQFEENSSTAQIKE